MVLSRPSLNIKKSNTMDFIDEFIIDCLEKVLDYDIEKQLNPDTPKNMTRTAKFVDRLIFNNIEKLLDRDVKEWSNPNPPGNVVERFIHNRLRKIIKDDFCEDSKDSQQTYDPSDPRSPDYDKYCKAVVEVKAATQKLIDTGMTDPIILHAKTGIPMEILVEMGIKVPVHRYIIPLTHETPGFISVKCISVKGVSPKDAITTLKNKSNTIAASAGLKVIADPSIIKRVTKLKKDGMIENTIDSHLISDAAITSLMKDTVKYK